MQISRTSLVRVVTVALGGFALASAVWAVPVAGAPATFDIAPQSLATALNAFARQSHEPILFTPEVVASRQSSGVRGTMEPVAALQILLKDSGLSYSATPGGAILVGGPGRGVEATAGAAVTQQDTKEGGKDSSRDFRVARVAEATTGVAVAAGTSQADSASIEEVIVTAQRREERLQDVPISVTVFNQATMDMQGTRAIDDVVRLTPAVTFIRSANNNNSASSDIAIRGIASNAGAATTGIYIDDTPIQTRHLSFGSFNAYPELFDIERVEVLRGPQGTLFGAGSEGGTIRFITPEPSLTQPSVYARSEIAATQDGDPVYEAGVAAGGPLIDKTLGGRVSVSYREEGGFIDRVDWRTGAMVDKNANAAKTVTARVALKWAPVDGLVVAPSFLYQKRNTDDTSAWWWIQPSLPPGDPTNGLFNSPLRSGNEIASPDSDRFMLGAVRIEWLLGSIDLVSNTSYFKRDEAATTDYSQFDRGIFLGNVYPPAGGVGTGTWADEQENWVQEFRLQSGDPGARLVWTAGLFFQHAKETTRQLVYDPAVQADIGLPPDTNGGFIYVEDPRIGVDKQVALFGQADFKVSEQLKLTLGARYAYAQFEGQAHYPETLVAGPAFDSSGSETDRPFTPKVGLTYQWSTDDLVYFTAAKGFRIGGANPRVGQFCYGGADSALGMIGLSEVPPNYGPDSVWSYEVGSKNALAGNRLLLNASAYYIRWKNIQQNVPLTACGFQYTGNLGEAKSTGFDLQSVFKMNNVLSMGATFSYTDAKYTETVQLAPTVLSIVQEGDHLPASPWTLTAFAQATMPLGSRHAYLRGDYQYSAKQTDTVAAANPLNGGFPQGFQPIPAQSYASARAGLTWGGWDVSLFSQNLFNSTPRLSAAEIFAPYSLYTVVSWRPRTSGLTVTYRY